MEFLIIIGIIVVIVVIKEAIGSQRDGVPQAAQELSRHLDDEPSLVQEADDQHIGACRLCILRSRVSVGGTQTALLHDIVRVDEDEE